MFLFSISRRFFSFACCKAIVQRAHRERIAGGKYLGRMFRLGREYQISDPQAAPFKYCGEPRHCRWNRCWTGWQPEEITRRIWESKTMQTYWSKITLAYISIHKQRGRGITCFVWQVQSLLVWDFPPPKSRLRHSPEIKGRWPSPVLQLFPTVQL